MSVRVNNKLPSFAGQANMVLNDALKEGARDVLVKAKTRAPFKSGDLRAASEIKQITARKWRISFWKEYARFQEFGGDSSRTVRNYSTSGTGRAYLKTSGDEVVAKMGIIFKKHAMRVKV